MENMCAVAKNANEMRPPRPPSYAVCTFRLTQGMKGDDDADVSTPTAQLPELEKLPVRFGGCGGRRPLRLPV